MGQLIFLKETFRRSPCFDRIYINPTGSVFSDYIYSGDNTTEEKEKAVVPEGRKACGRRFRLRSSWKSDLPAQGLTLNSGK